MTESAIHQFIDMVAGKVFVEVKVVKDIPVPKEWEQWAKDNDGYMTMKFDDDIPDKPKLEINQRFLDRESDVRIKEGILHEIGHSIHDPSLSISDGEYEAQVWAIGKSREMGDKELEVVAVKVLESWGKGDFPAPYKEAYKKAECNGIIKRRRYEFD